MARELKFRVWCGKQKVMLNPFTLEEAVSNAPAHWHPTGDVFMQCTGLKDRNGKEIYDGDVLRYVKEGRTSTQKKRASETHYWNVFFDEKGQWRARRAGEQPEAIWDKVANHEVVGNIYETSHHESKEA